MITKCIRIAAATAIATAVLTFAVGGQVTRANVVVSREAAKTVSQRVAFLAAQPPTKRPNFVGAFFRPQGPAPFGIFNLGASQVAPVPYPTPGTEMLGRNGYCNAIAANGASIDGSYSVDPIKLSNMINLGVRWTRMPAPQFNVDLSHTFGPGKYAFGALDAAQCVSFAYHHITPVINLEAGPVQYNSRANAFSPKAYNTYKTASDFGQWCGVVAAHERSVFPSVTRYSLPGNEVNSNVSLFPGGLPQIAAYSKSCYAAIKAANPNAFVYGFELNMDGSLNAPGFVRRMVGLGCRVGTCYDGLAIHLSLRYPIPAAATPCYPNRGGDYSLQCVSDIETAAGGPIHVLVSETVYPVPGSVPNEATKAKAVTAEYTAFAANPTIDGVAYANVDECGSYQSGYFAGGCLIDTSNRALPAFRALQWLASRMFK